MIKSIATPAVSTSITEANILDFKNAVHDMGAMSQGGLSKIASIARLALAALQMPAGPRRDKDIANALTAIRDIAEDTESCISFRANEFGADIANGVEA